MWSHTSYINNKNSPQNLNLTPNFLFVNHILRSTFMETRKSPVRNQITKTSCNLSQAVYDWSCQHCLARYLVALPNRAMRQLWAQRWEQIYGKETADSIYDLGRRMYLEVSK